MSAQHGKSPEHPDRWIGSWRGNSRSASTDQKPDGPTRNGATTNGTGCPGRSNMRAILLGILVAAVFAIAAPPAGRAQAPSMLLIRGATIIDGVSDAPLQDRSLLIEGNIIRELPHAGPAAPPGAQGPRPPRHIP